MIEKAEKDNISFDEAIERVSREDRFKATVYAMNTLLIQKRIYTTQEFEANFCQWVESILKERASSIPA